MPSATVIAGTVFALIAVFAGYIYLVGIPPEMKRKLEKQALRTMGEVSQRSEQASNRTSFESWRLTFFLQNKASYMFKSQLDAVPDGPGGPGSEELKDVKKGLGDIGGSALQNPLGEAAGEGADEATRPLTGR